jgi:hypothetical protein
MNKETKCTCERPDDNTCNYCEQESSIQILEEAAENFYREYPTNPLDKPEWHYNRDVDCFKKRKAFINGAKYMAEKMYSEEEVYELLLKHQSAYRSAVRNTSPLDWSFDIKQWFENFKKK